MMLTVKEVVSTTERMDAAVIQRLEERQNIHPFMQGFLHSLGVDAAYFENFLAAKRSEFLLSFRNALNASHGAIPGLVHRVWLSDPAQGHSPDEDMLSEIKANARRTPEFSHMIWCNSERVREELRAFFSSEVNLVVLSTAQYETDPLWPSVERLIEARKFVLAADFLRMVVLKHWGGFYCDIGMIVERKLLRIAQLSDITVFLGGNMFFQTSFLGTRRDAPFINLISAALLQPQAIAFLGGWYMNSLDAEKEVDVLAGPGFTALLMLFATAAGDRVFVTTNENEQIRWRSSASWYAPSEKFGNTRVAATSPTFLSQERIDLSSADWSNNVLATRGFTELSHRLRVLTGVISALESSPTLLQQIMTFFGSDKGGGWHNYACVYQYIFPHFAGATTSLVEIGIGTNNPDLPSTMGAGHSPGASLRGWREFFAPRAVIGCDIDTEILFQEPGISTHFVDQRSDELLTALWRKVAPEGVRLAIDDGLHEFDANVLSMETAFRCLPDLELFVIEDVAIEYVEPWKHYLASSSYEYVFLDLPNAANKRDNRLIFLRRGSAVEG